MDLSFADSAFIDKFWVTFSSKTSATMVLNTNQLNLDTGFWLYAQSPVRMSLFGTKGDGDVFFDSTHTSIDQIGQNNAFVANHLKVTLPSYADDSQISHIGSYGLINEAGQNSHIGTDASGNIVLAPATSVSVPSIKATTGTRYVCVDVDGNLVSSASPCSGT
jgi:hypothetical protein